MSRVQTLVMAIGGVYRRRMLPQQQDQPVDITNEKDKQRYLLRGAPIFMKNDPVELEHIADLLEVEPPLQTAAPEKRVMLVEEDNPFPIGRVATAPTPDEQLHLLKDMRQAWYQLTEHKAQADSMGKPSDKVTNLWIVLALGMGVLIAIMALKVLLESKDAATTAMLAQLGAMI